MCYAVMARPEIGSINEQIKKKYILQRYSFRSEYKNLDYEVQ